jgi:hypothetical protein
MTEPIPTGPPQQRTGTTDIPVLDEEELDITDVAPDPDAMQHIDTRLDNASGADAPRLTTPRRSSTSEDGAP